MIQHTFTFELNMRFKPFLQTIGLLAIAALMGTSARAGVPEPDNILYGTIIIDGVLITSNRTDIVVEARRSTQGPAIASYRMGDRTTMGNNYSLRLTMESSAPASDPNAVLVGETVFVTIKGSTGDLKQVQFPVTQRGDTVRLDFAFGDQDADGDGLPDAWEIARFGDTSATAGGNNDGDRFNNLQEYIAGTNPTDPSSVFGVSISRNGSQTTVSFQTIAATGAGYDGLTRRYTLERSSLLNNDWQAITGWTDIVGSGQAVSYQPGGSEPQPAFYRARVTLQP